MSFCNPAAVKSVNEEHGMYYPLRFKPVFKDYIWGGRSLEDLGKILPREGRVAESWEISAHPHGMSVISNGMLAGISLADAGRKLGGRLLGNQVPESYQRRFPLLVKLIDANDRLSVQVHPDDAYARRFENGESGKNEMWYVVFAKPGARLIAGLAPGVTRDTFAASIADGTCLEMLHEIPVQAGDAINIPAGLVHAIGEGLLICEIQQNADTTYRVYDYDRRDSNGQTRPLHIEKALDVIDFCRSGPVPLLRGLVIETTGLTRRALVLNRHFYVEELQVSGRAVLNSDGSRFRTVTVIAGKGGIAYRSEAGHQLSEPLFAGDSLLVPASLGPWELTGNLRLLSSQPALFAQDAAELAVAAGQTDIAAWLDQAAASGQLGLEPRPEA